MTARDTAPRCDALLSPTLERCPNPAEYEVVAGCVHEHARRGVVCPQDADQIRTRDDAGALTWCGACYDGDRAHRCRLHPIRIERLVVTHG